MSERDLVSKIAGRESVRPAVLSGTTSGEIVDLRGFESAVAHIQTGAIVSSGNFTPSIQIGDDSGLSDAETIAAPDLLTSLTDPLAANSVYLVGFRVRKRYARVVLTKNSGTSIAAGASIIGDNAGQTPVT